ncbi:P-type conjugative transfer protein TrbL [Burkholderia cenocepacia]|uniref:P-type conjugative transfer protein TrbL n=1 Tax=Burkholderia cenocepacia TaxID=95486 RepID=UPI001B9096B6|nr:P-type conjugative transfer protein TrbL [Burkholderia cenocepacia]MBR7945376.1 P-type conjugative transfer protein TrbL [Burkholderia cenocepacia]
MKKVPVLPSVFMALLFFAAHAHAAPLDSGDLLNNILHKYADVASTWQNKMVSYANWLFWGLVLISMVWTFGLMALKNAGLTEALAELVRFFAVTGFFWWILSNGPAMSMSIIDSMRMMASNASGVGNSLSPSGIVDIAFSILEKTRAAADFWSPVVSAIMLLTAVVVLVVMALIAVNMVLLLVAGWFLAYGGVFLLGFGGGRWTTDIAINYYKTVLGLGVQIFAMILLVGIGQSFVDQYYAAFQNGKPDLNSLCVLLVSAVVLLVLVTKIPPMLASVVGGGLSAGIGSFGAGAAVGAAGFAASAATSVGSAAMAGATSAAGGANALKAAFQSAQQHMAEGSGMFSGSGGGGSGGLGGGSGGGGGSGSLGGGASSSSGGSGGFSSFMSNAGRFAADMGSNLAKGAGQVAKDKAASMMDSAKERIGQTTGGRIAAAIRGGSDYRDSAGADTASFAGDSLGAGNDRRQQQNPMNDEVAAFVNQDRSSREET